MMLQVTIGGVEVSYDDGIDDIPPSAAYLESTLSVVRLNAINAWMALPTILDTDAELDAVDLEAAPTDGDA